VAVTFSDVRIADLTTVTAGAGATQMLADLGADVIKVESRRHMDPFRVWIADSSPEARSAAEWDASPPFNAINRNKRGLAVDLKHPRGREVFLRLVAVSDVVAENFRRGVPERLGLDFNSLREARPDIVLVTLSSQGEDGPERNYGSFGSTLEALGGMMSVSGYGPDRPIWSGNDVNYPDQVVAMFGASLIMLGLRQRTRTGQGVHIDLSQRELVTMMVGEVVLEFTVNGRVPQPRGNREVDSAPNGCYRCSGEDQWVAISIETDAQWVALCSEIGSPSLRRDTRYSTVAGRIEHESSIDAAIESWTSMRDKRDVMRRLQAAGVPAGAVMNGAELLVDPFLEKRGFFRPVEHPVAGRQRQRTWPFSLSRIPFALRSPAPRLGEHTGSILRELLGYSTADVDRLEQLGVITFTEGVPR
jgi:crotonobetainyl-CoA:carnitine CoA-transferase CaiB-like acyl-CoA transferase